MVELATAVGAGAPDPALPGTDPEPAGAGGTAIALGRSEVSGVGVAGAAAQVLWHHRLIRDRSREGCFHAFRVNHWVGLAVFAGVVGEFALR